VLGIDRSIDRRFLLFFWFFFWGLCESFFWNPHMHDMLPDGSILVQQKARARAPARKRESERASTQCCGKLSLSLSLSLMDEWLSSTEWTIDGWMLLFLGAFLFPI
jgi:hypothetical protein